MRHVVIQLVFTSLKSVLLVAFHLHSIFSELHKVTGNVNTTFATDAFKAFTKCEMRSGARSFSYF